MNIATGMVPGSADGYTLLNVTTINAGTLDLQRSRYNFVRDIAPVAA